ncbi:6773_t:CDS:2, partial [Acaulospora morrowiae]
MRANVTYAQLLKYSDQRKNLSKIMKRTKPPEETNQVSTADTLRMTAAKCYIRVGDKTVVAVLDTGAAFCHSKWYEGEDFREGKELEIPISHNGIEGLVRPDESESSDYKSGGTYGEFEYESEKVEEEKGYYTGKRSGEGTTDQESVAEKTTGREEAPPSKVKTEEMEIPSPAIYLTVLKEIPTPEEEESVIGEPKTDMDNLIEKERGEVAKLFETEKELFTGSLEKLTQTD